MSDYQTDNLYLHEQAADQQKLLLNRYMMKVYNWMAAGLALSALTAWICLTSVTVFRYFIDTNTGAPTTLFWICMVAELGLVFGLSAGIKRLPVKAAAALFVVYSSLNGFVLGPILLAYTASSVTKAFFVSAAVFVAASAYGSLTKRNLSAMGQFMFMGLIGIIIASLVNFFMASSTLDFIICYVGVIVFVGLTAYDNQAIRAMLSQAANETTVSKMAIFGALKLYLDFINLFLILLRILGDRR
ncbi:MAG: Bax inhibitor-1/YccA family protein [Desulfarculales bacterium]|jgi:FtsH-binding integral membrane protein|nr:Bax inhibitor-1/YccA family protein [Desulfarculales bacterium]